jgi:hypothetical protein
MNIKGLNSSPISPIEPRQRVDGRARAQNAADRDADGRREQAEPELKRHLSQQEFDDALQALQSLPGLIANHLSIKVETHEDRRIILILDPDGNVVRRLSEQQLWAAARDKDRQTGRILDKAM